MTDIWNEINLDSITYESDLDPLRVRTYLEKLKAHYMPIEEKADAMLRFRKAAEDLGEYAADLKDKLDAIRDKVAEWDSTHMRDRNAAPSILADLENILEAED